MGAQGGRRSLNQVQGPRKNLPAAAKPLDALREMPLCGCAVRPQQCLLLQIRGPSFSFLDAQMDSALEPSSYASSQKPFLSLLFSLVTIYTMKPTILKTTDI